MKTIRTALSIALLGMGLIGTASAAEVNMDTLKSIPITAKFIEATTPLESDYEPVKENITTGEVGLDTVLGKVNVKGGKLIGISWQDGFLPSGEDLTIGTMTNENGEKIQAKFTSDTSKKIGEDSNYSIFENSDETHQFSIVGAAEKKNVEPGTYTALINIVEAQK